MTPLERVARAIFETAEAVDPASFVSPQPRDLTPGVWLVTIDGRFDMLAVARAVLAALAEPTPGMVEAGLLAMTRDVVESGNIEAVWTAMLAKAGGGGVMADELPRKLTDPWRWDDGRVVHLVSGADVHPDVRLLWPRCGKGDVPANAAVVAPDMPPTCEACTSLPAPEKEPDDAS